MAEARTFTFAEEVDCQPDGSVHQEGVGHTRGDRMAVAGVQPGSYGGKGLHGEHDRTISHSNAPPGPLGNQMGSSQTGRQAALIEGPSRADDTETRRQLGPIAERAVDLSADPRVSPCFRQHPASFLERRAVANVLVVKTGQLGYPAACIILVESGDPTNHGFRSCHHWMAHPPPLRRTGARHRTG